MARLLCAAFSRAYIDRFCTYYGFDFEFRMQNVIRRHLTFCAGVILNGPSDTFDIARTIDLRKEIKTKMPKKMPT